MTTEDTLVLTSVGDPLHVVNVQFKIPNTVLNPREFDSKWDGILLWMTQIPSDDILEGLYKLRIRESEKLKTVPSRRK